MIATTLTANCWCVGQPTSAKYVNNPQQILYNLPVSIIISIHMLNNRFTVKNKYLSCLNFYPSFSWIQGNYFQEDGEGTCHCELRGM